MAHSARQRRVTGQAVSISNADFSQHRLSIPAGPNRVPRRHEPQASARLGLPSCRSLLLLVVETTLTGLKTMSFGSTRVVQLHSHDMSDFTPAEIAEMEVDPWDEAMKYSKAMVILICSGIAFFGLLHLFAQIRKTRTGRRSAKTPYSQRKTAFFRWISTSQPRAAKWITFPTRGVIILLAIVWMFAIIWSLAQQPYYRSRWNVGSPPLAIRTGMFAVGLFPFILAFGAKWNLVSFVTGYSHEKLQVFHQWFSHLFLLLSLLHTFPFVMAGRERKPGTNYSQIYYNMFVAHKVYYWTGVACLVTLAWLCWASFVPIRKRAYELFKVLHIISAILFSAFFYLHCNALLTSWHYIWAAAAVYFTSVVMRFGLLIVRNGHKVPMATVEAASEGCIRVTIEVPKQTHRWDAGQHFFLNFIKACPFESHPYTISNSPYLHPNAQAPARQAVVLLRPSSRSALAPRLLALASANKPTPVLLDGPYGGLSKNADLGVHDTVLLLVGGSGASFATALLEDLCGRILRGDKTVDTKRIELHWVVRTLAAKSWFDEHIDQVRTLVDSDMIELHLYVTEEDMSSQEKALLAAESSGPSSVASTPFEKERKLCHASKSASPSPTPSHTSSRSWRVHSSKPNLGLLLKDKLGDDQVGNSVGIACCGPHSFNCDVRNAVAQRQKQIAFGKTGGKGAQEVELHVEEFDW
ncbi:hypothetical protein ACM66B_006663 [Microbotryomycetes sp. NB124-2]